VRSKADERASLLQRTAPNKEATEKPGSSEETVQLIVIEGSLGGGSQVKLRTQGFVKQVGFKPGVKEWGSYGWAEWWIKRRRSDRYRNRWVRNRETGTGMRLTKRHRELIWETRWSEQKERSVILNEDVARHTIWNLKKKFRWLNRNFGWYPD